MMIYRHDSSRVVKKIITYIVLGILVFVLWKPFKFAALPVLEKTGFFSSYIYMQVATRLNTVSLYVATNNALYQENIQLQSELEKQKLQYLEYRILYDRIKKYENIENNSSIHSVYATRIGPIDTILHDSFRINKGSRESIEVSDLVIAFGNILVGSVVEVSESTSLVSLPWNGQEITGRASASGTVMVLRGAGSGVYIAEVPHEMVFEVGEVITYDAQPDIILGVVKKINNNEEDRFKEIIIHTPIHPGMIDAVLVQKSKDI